jgi:hypothetical protein
MRRHHYALFFLILLVVILIIGWKRGWFTVNRENVQRDEEKIKQTIEGGADKAKEEANKLLNKDANK